MNLSEFLIDYLESHRLSQREFARKCNVSNGYISMLVNGINPKTGKPITPSPQSLRNIATGLGMSLHQLLSTVDDIDLDVSIPINKSFPLSDEEEELLSYFRSMNPQGRMAALASVKGIHDNPIYKKYDDSLAVLG